MLPTEGRRRWIFAGLFAASFLFAGMQLWLATSRGIGLFGDSVDYIAPARQIVAGAGVRTLDGHGGYTPLTQFPPGYPFMIAAASKITGMDAVDAARPLHVLVHLALVALIPWLTYQASQSAAAALLACALASVAMPLVMTDSRVYSEGPFICLMLFTFSLLNRALRDWRWAAVAGLTLGAACLTRFAGILLLPIGGVILLLLNRKNWRTGLLHAGLFGIATILPIFAWNLRNAHVTGRASARKLVFHPMPLSSWRDAAETIVSWMLPERLPWMPVVCGILVIAFIVLLSLAFVRRERIESRALPILLGAFLLLYLPFLFFASSFIDANVNFSPRLMVPMFPCVIVLVAMAWSTLANPTRCVVLTILLAAVIYNAIRTTRWSCAMSKRGQGYASTPWVHSDTLKAIAGAPQDLPIYTNGYDVIYLRTGRLVNQLPKARIRSMKTTNPALDAEMDAMTKSLREKDGWIVLLDRIDRDDYLISEDELRGRLPLKPARRKQPDDGKILRLGE